MISDQEMHDTTGMQQASLGKKSNEKSGRAIMARQHEGDVANYTFYDNLGRAMRYQGRVLVDLIPKIYDTPRIIRILGKDGMEQSVPINQQFKDKDGMDKLYDLTVGKYDVSVTIGPSFTTEREEAAENMMTLIGAVPQAGMLISDLLVKNLDWPGADEISKRLRLLLPPELQAEAGGGEPVKPAPPDPVQILTMKKLDAEARGAELDAEIKFVQLQRLKAGLPMEPKDFPPQDVTKGNGKDETGNKKGKESGAA
jgi:hypothetical protein